jgi:hypothetical protein
VCEAVPSELGFPWSQRERVGANYVERGVDSPSLGQAYRTLPEQSSSVFNQLPGSGQNESLACAVHYFPVYKKTRCNKNGENDSMTRDEEVETRSVIR